MQNFRSLTQLLYRYELLVLATAIEQQGIYFRNDTLGTVKIAKNDGDAWQCRRDPLHMQKIIYHTEDKKTASRTTKSRALVLLEMYSETRGLRGICKAPMTDAYRMELRNFGWDEDSLPDFDAIQQGSVTQTKVEIGSEKTPSKIQQKFDVISDTIKNLGYDEPLCIPPRGKTKIKEECLNNSELFTTNSFDYVWKKGKKVNPPLWEVENVEQYKNN